MSASIKSTFVKAALVTSVVAFSSVTAAKEVSLNHYLGLSVHHQMNQLSAEINYELEQEIYTSAFASLKTDAKLPNYRPAVSIQELQPAEEDEE